MKLDDVVRKRIDRLNSLLAGLGRAEKVVFSTEDMVKRLADTHARFPKSTGDGSVYLYRITLTSPDVTPEMLCKKFRAARRKGICNLSRDNNRHDSRTLYVGTSKDLHGRFRTHLGTGSGTTTWALYLSRWPVAGATFKVEYHRFPAASEVDVELIEGILWEASKPLFGKRGGWGA